MSDQEYKKFETNGYRYLESAPRREGFYVVSFGRHGAKMLVEIKMLREGLVVYTATENGELLAVEIGVFNMRYSGYPLFWKRLHSLAVV